ncbi:small ribosomal subunit protein uS10m-like [Bidens hawaiensis]|uniref:small ribosomal subunit protein uS10m-like n=1 Tax=Bidens hawaiensis TaxID=980011 RepID=UPI00404AD8EA
MTSSLRNLFLKSVSGNVTLRHETRRFKSDFTKIQIMIKSFDPNSKTLHRELPPTTRMIGLPSRLSLFTVLKSPHVHKKAREQFHMKINKQMLVMEAKRNELRNKFFWLKRQRIFGSQFEVLFSFKTRLEKDKLQKVLQSVVFDLEKSFVFLLSTWDLNYLKTLDVYDAALGFLSQLEMDDGRLYQVEVYPQRAK